MPTRRSQTDETEALDLEAAVSAFRWSARGAGLDHPLGKPHFQTQADAMRAWAAVRRHVWARTYRFTVPATAVTYDGLTSDARQFIFDSWNHVGAFALTRALILLARDRANLARFAKTPGARAIKDYLDLYRADLDTIEAAARALAASPHEGCCRTYPAHLGTGATYERGIERAAKRPASDRRERR